jgi:hypothetical protein
MDVDEFSKLLYDCEHMNTFQIIDVRDLEEKINSLVSLPSK